LNTLIDTNVILDDILDRAPNAEAAREISRLVTDELVAALNYIVTNDKGFLSDMYSSVSTISPANFLLKLQG